MKNICYMDFTCLVGDLCYSSKLCFFPPLCGEDTQWFSLSVCQDGAVSIKEVTKSAGTREHSCSYRADHGQTFLWVENVKNGGGFLRDDVILGYIRAPKLYASYLPLSQYSAWAELLCLMQLFPKWRYWYIALPKRRRNNSDLRSPFPQLLKLLTWPKTAEIN